MSAFIPIWHVVWTTKGVWTPQDSRGDWARLAELYESLVAEKSVAPLHPLHSRYAAQTSPLVTLSSEDAIALLEWLQQLTTESGDRVARGHPVRTAVFMPTQVHLMLRCRFASLNQVVGRIKSRLATLLLFEARWKNKARVIWSRGF